MRFEPAPCDLLLATACAAWLINRLLNGGRVLLENANWMLLGFLLTGWIGVASAPSLPQSVRFAAITTYLAAFYYLTRQASRDFSLRKKIISLYLASALITVGLVWITIAVAPFGLLPEDSLLTFRTRPIALFKDPNVTGVFIVPAALYFLWQCLQFTRPAGTAALYLLSECAVFLTLSRGALMSLGLGCGMIFLLTPSTWRKRLTLMVLSVLVVELLSFVLAFYPATAVKGLERSFPHMPFFRYVVTEKSLPPVGMLGVYREGVIMDYDRGGRAYAWKAGLEIFKERPLLGTGPGSFESLSPAIEEQLGAKFITPSAHNLYIRALAENGIIGFTLLLAFFIYAWRSARYTGDNLWIKAALIALLVNAFFIDTIHHRHLWLLLAFL